MTDFSSPTPATTSDEPSAKDKAAAAAQTGRQAAGEVAQTAVGAAQDVAQQTASQVRDVAGKARQQVSEQVGVQQSALADGLRSLADQLSAMTDVDQDGVAVELAGTARDRTRRAAEWLEEREPSDVLDEVRDFGRRRPAVFLLGAAAAGLLAGRLTRGVAAAHSDTGPSAGDANAAPDRPAEATPTGQHHQVDRPLYGGGYNDAAQGPSGRVPVTP